MAPAHGGGQASQTIRLDRGRTLNPNQRQQEFRAKPIPLQLGQLGTADLLSGAMALKGGESGNQGFTAPDPVRQAACSPRRRGTAAGGEHPPTTGQGTKAQHQAPARMQRMEHSIEGHRSARQKQGGTTP